MTKEKWYEKQLCECGEKAHSFGQCLVCQQRDLKRWQEGYRPAERPNQTPID